MSEAPEGFIACTNPKKEGVRYFKESTARKKSWQQSTGWTPQEQPASPPTPLQKRGENTDSIEKTAIPSAEAVDKTKSAPKKKLISADTI